LLYDYFNSYTTINKYLNMKCSFKLLIKIENDLLLKKKKERKKETKFDNYIIIKYLIE